jgi:hypothetical protein
LRLDPLHLFVEDGIVTQHLNVAARVGDRCPGPAEQEANLLLRPAQQHVRQIHGKLPQQGDIALMAGAVQQVAQTHAARDRHAHGQGPCPLVSPQPFEPTPASCRQLSRAPGAAFAGLIHLLLNRKLFRCHEGSGVMVDNYSPGT